VFLASNGGISRQSRRQASSPCQLRGPSSLPTQRSRGKDLHKCRLVNHSYVHMDANGADILTKAMGLC